MTTPTLPDPALAEAARTALRALDRFERSLLDVSFEGRIASIDSVAVSDGRGHITSLFIAPALIPTAGGQQAVILCTWITHLLNLALANAKVHADRELNRTLASFPPADGKNPASISGHAGKFLSNCYSGTAAQGQITVSVHWSWNVTAVTIADAFFTSPDRSSLADLVREAANSALAEARQAIECAAAGLAHLLASAPPEDVVRAKEIRAHRVRARVIYAKEVKAASGAVRVVYEDRDNEEWERGRTDARIETDEVHADVIYAKEIVADVVEADEIHAKKVRIGR